MGDAIVLRGVRKTFGPKVAVEGMDLVVPEGRLVGFIGPNGAGKTTTIRMVMSILFPDSGEISVLGRKSAIESKDRIGYLPEERGVYRKMKVLPFLVYMGRLKGLDAAAASRQAREWLDRVELGEVAKKKCEELSKGMQQKVQFIASVIHQPDLLILDEVFSGLDPMNRRLMRGLIDEQHRAGRTIVFSTHAMFEAEQICDHILMIHNGRKVLDAGMQEIRERFDPNAVLVEPSEPDAEERLRHVPGVRSVTRGEGGSATLEARLDGALTTAEGIRAIVNAIPVNRIEVKRITLEDVFIDLVEASGQAAPSRDEIRQTTEVADA